MTAWKALKEKPKVPGDDLEQASLHGAFTSKKGNYCHPYHQLIKVKILLSLRVMTW